MKVDFKAKYYYTDYTKKYYEDGTFYNDPKSPGLVVFKPTLKCCANCKHCSPRSKKFSTDKILNLEDYDKLIKDLKQMGTKQICISGGEPLVYKNIIELIKLITMNGLKVSINTNGWLLTLEKFKELMDAGVVCVNLSIDSPYAKDHDELRRLPGLFERATKYIKQCKESGIPFKFNLRMVLSKHNYKDIEKMIDLARDLNADILSIDMIEADSKNKLFLLNREEIKDFKENYVPVLVDKIQKLNIKNELKDFNVKQLQDMFNTKFNPIENFENGIYWPDDRIKCKCDIPQSFMIIEGDGMVLPCNAVEYNRDKIVGNVLDTNIKELWKSEKWKNFRKNKMDFCLECPMNMSYMMVFNDDEIERECLTESFTTEKIQKLIMMDKTKDYNEERLEEYLKFFNKDKKFIDDINNKFGIDSLEFKVNFLYPNYFNNMDNNEEIFNSYKTASLYYSLRQLLGRPEKFNPQLHIFDFMKKNLKLGSIVMDYGCCVGDFSILFGEMGFKVLAYDLDIPTFDFALQRFKDRKLDIQGFKVGQDMSLPNQNKKVDFVFCRDVLEHTTNPLEVLQYFYNNLNENGYLYTSTMNPGDDIYIGAEHLEKTIKLAKTKEYKKFFEDRFVETGIKGLYYKK